jgi:hypothetical protein
MNESLARRAGALALAVVVAVLVMRPLVWTPGSLPAYPGAPRTAADRDLHTWTLAWTAHAILHEPRRLFDGNVFFPAENVLAGSDAMLADLPVTTPVWAMTHDATWVLKAAMLWGLLGTALAVFLLAAGEAPAWVAALAAAAVALEPGRIAALGAGPGMGAAPQYLGLQFAPLALLAALLWARTGRPAALAAFAVALALQALACLALGGWTFLLVPVAGALVLGARGMPGLVGLGFATIGGLVLALPPLWPHVIARVDDILPPPAPGLAAQASLGATGMVVAAAWLGPLVLLLGTAAVAAAVLELRAARSPARAAERAGLVLGLLGLVFAIGPTATLPGGIVVPLPYRWLEWVVPEFAMIGAPLRALSLAGLGFAIAGAAAVGRVTRGWPAWRGAALAGVGVLVALRWVAPASMPVEPAPLGRDLPPVYAWLAAQPRTGGVLEVPGAVAEEDAVGVAREARYALLSTAHWQRIVNGHATYPPPWSGLARALARRLPDADALQTLVNLAPVTLIVVHGDALAPAMRERWAEEATGAGLEEIERFGTDVVYRITREPSVDLRFAPRVPPREVTLENTPTAPLDPACRQATLDVRFPATIPAGTAPHAIAVQVRNDSGCRWPALGVLTSGLVVLRAEWPDVPAGTAPPMLAARLPHDLAPGDAADTDALVLPPRATGTHTLRILLEQDGVPGVIASAEGAVDVRIE